jgi:hypothetical protein
MTQPSHPRLRARGTLPERSKVLALVYSPCKERAAWIEREVFAARGVIQVGRSIPMLIAALTDESSRRPQILVVDIDGLSPGELMHLHTIRELGWFGTLIALGHVPNDLKISLQIDKVIEAPHAQTGFLTAMLARHQVEVGAQTMPLPTFEDL